jgi:16S rRNA processing protein RimM
LSLDERFILVGRLGRARGVRGAVWVTPLTDFPERFGQLKEIFLNRKGAWEQVKVEWAQVISGRPVLKLAGYENREDVARLANSELAVTADQLVKLPAGTFYVFDLIGCTVMDEESGSEVGEVIDVVRYPANDVYVIRDRAGREVLFPAVTDFVRKIDLDARKMIIRKAGLFEEPDSEPEP